MQLFRLFSSYMKTNPVALFLCAIILFCMQARAEFCPAMTIDPAIDAFLYRIASRYNVPLPPSFFSQPMTVCDVLQVLDKADSLGTAGLLSASERADISELRRRISPDNALVHWKNKKNDAHVGIRVILADTNAASIGVPNTGYVRGIASPSLQAGLGPISFYSGIDVWTDYLSLIHI